MKREKTIITMRRKVCNRWGMFALAVAIAIVGAVGAWLFFAPIYFVQEGLSSSGGSSSSGGKSSTGGSSSSDEITYLVIDPVTGNKVAFKSLEEVQKAYPDYIVNT